MSENFLLSTEPGFATTTKEVPATLDRKAPLHLKDLGNAGSFSDCHVLASQRLESIPMVHLEKDPIKPQILQQHVEYFDTDGDGVIGPLDTLKRTHELGFNIFFSIFVMTVIHGSFSYVTQKSWIPFFGNPFFNIYIDNIHNAKHGSDSEVLDTEGRYIPEKFEEIFSKYDRNNKGGLNFSDIAHMIYVNANVFDFFGWFSTILEWGTLYLLCAGNKRMISKEDVRTCYDVSYFCLP
ncbi:8124_t:CDS:2 [Funneliformis caledonium]|uniref:8124_t:CDS:1 n=1 Tax=Funneliformis caledonium TaxID=1117310 RepID=A0A9N8ZJI2_9GLOM|nr:8124_t:CDS:2 [Funneliformis caledonium]